MAAIMTYVAKCGRPIVPEGPQRSWRRCGRLAHGHYIKKIEHDIAEGVVPCKNFRKLDKI